MRFSESQDFYSKNVCAKLFAIYNPLYFNDDKKKSAQKVFVKIFFPFFPIEKKKQRNTCFWLKDFFSFIISQNYAKEYSEEKFVFVYWIQSIFFAFKNCVSSCSFFCLSAKSSKHSETIFSLLKKKFGEKTVAGGGERCAKYLKKKNYNRKKSDPHENYEWRAQSIDTMSNLILKKLWLSLLSFSMKNM